MSKITIKDVANRCKVSVSTVSRAINNHPEISLETRDFILDTIKSMGYLPSSNARNLKRTKTNTIAVLIKGIDNPFFHPMFKLIEQQINKKGYSFLLHKVEEHESELDVAIKLINDEKPEGIIFLGGAFIVENDLNFEKIDVPAVVVSMIRHGVADEGISYIGVDDFIESQKLVNYLISLGHTKIAVIGSRKNDNSVGKLRIDGYRKAMKDHGIAVDESLIVMGEQGDDPYTFEYGYKMASKILDCNREFSAVYCISDAIAIGFLKRMYEMGYQVPRDYSLVGFDGLKINEFLPKSITTMKQPVEEMVLRACDELFNMIEEIPSQSCIVLAADLWIGNTTTSIIKSKGIERSNMLKQRLNELALKKYERDLGSLSKSEIFNILVEFTKEEIQNKPKNIGDKKLYYVSAEFLIGKLLSNNLINLGYYTQIREILNEMGINIEEIEELELEPSLGNGGLGRLAACFLDSIATLGLHGDGIGINYHYGLFKQEFRDNKQFEAPNPWLTNTNFLDKTDISFDVQFKDFSVNAKLYDIAVTGYESGSNKLHLFDIDSVNEHLVQGGISFDKRNIKENLTLFLYPDDSDTEGRLLRIYQQYFMVSAGAQLILKELEDAGHGIHDLDKYAVIQINDTHPALIIPEFIRLLTEKGMEFERAVEVVTAACAYTNHTILSEALEKWPMDYLEQVVPHLVPIIRKLDEMIKSKYDNYRLHIIDGYNVVHMANMAIHFSSSTNGVARLHTEILINEELRDFYDIYPERFNNKTNGITFRRWLIDCNEGLSNYICSLIGSEYKKDASKLEELLKFYSDEEVLEHIAEIKHAHKVHLANYIKAHEGIELNPDSIFDIQIKRLHEYKRQQMNVLYIIGKYLEIKRGILPKTPITMIFGAKAAPAYIIAKDIINLILSLQSLIESDEEVKKHLRVVMVQNYNVTYAQNLIPACDISEQISLASKEASGTGNMKFMLNGAITLGTMDGANVEIAELVGKDNIYIFGKSSEEVIDLYKNNAYHPRQYYSVDEYVTSVVDFILSEELLRFGDRGMLERLHWDITNKDYFMALLDLKEYKDVKDRVLEDYEDVRNWRRKMLVNIAKAGYFSSDRTIEDYNKEIWHLR